MSGDPGPSEIAAQPPGTRSRNAAEFIKSDADDKFYFLEVAARVGGAYIAEVLEAELEALPEPEREAE